MSQAIIPSDSTAVEIAREHLETMLVELSNELKQRFDDPGAIKDMLSKMSVSQILTHMMRIMNTVKKNQILLPMQVNLNLQKVSNYAIAMSENEQKRKQLRSQARKQLRFKPS